MTNAYRSLLPSRFKASSSPLTRKSLRCRKMAGELLLLLLLLLLAAAAVAWSADIGALATSARCRLRKNGTAHESSVARIHVARSLCAAAAEPPRIQNQKRGP